MTVKGFLGKVSMFGMVSTLMTLNSAIQLPVQAQFSGCVNAGSYGSWGSGSPQLSDRDISIGREIYKTVAWMGPRDEGETVVTCRLTPTSGSTFSYAAGYSDMSRNSPPAVLIVYINGNEVSRQTIQPGQLYTKMFDTTGATSISIEAVCTRSSGCNTLYFTTLGSRGRRLPGAR
jgi:hypothetical protein